MRARQTKDSGGRARSRAAVALMATAFLAAALSTFQWLELLRVQAGGETFCSINATFNCASVWESSFAKSLHALSRVPVAGWGLVWALTGFGSAAMLYFRLSRRAPVSGIVAAVWLTAATGVVVSIGLFVVSARIEVFCLTCIGTYSIVAAYAILASRLMPLSHLSRADLVQGALLSCAFTFGGYALVLYPGLATPTESSSLGLPKRAPNATGDREPGVVSAQPSTLRPGDASGDRLADYLEQLPVDVRGHLAEALADLRRAERKDRTPWPARCVLGSRDAPLHVVEWSDIRCGHCKKFSAALHEIMANNPEGAFSLELRQFPLDGSCNPNVPKEMTDGSGVRCTAARALICLEGRPGFREAQEKMFLAQDSLTRDRVLEIATGSGIDRPTLESCLLAAETDAKLRADIDFAMAYDIEGTPLVVLDGRMAEGMPQLLYAMVLARGDLAAPGWNVLPAPSETAHD